MGLVVFPSGDSLFRASPQLSRSATVTSTQGEKNVVMHDTGDLKQTCEHYRVSLPSRSMERCGQGSIALKKED